MNNNTVKEIDVLLMARRTRFLGIAILLGMFLVFIFGVFVSKDSVNADMEFLNYISFAFCITLCIISIFLKKSMIQKVTIQNAANQYFNSHVLPFALCDLGGLICIMSNLFINQNLIFAAAGLLVTTAAMIINFPKDDDYIRLKL